MSVFNLEKIMKAKLLRCMNRVMNVMWIFSFIIVQLSVSDSHAFASAANSYRQQTIQVSGKVVSSLDQSAIPGVNILIKGTSNGTVTDAEGKYTIQVPGDESVLVFSSIGFDSQEVSVGGKSVIDVNLLASTTELDEIVVVGYGTQEKVSVTSSVSALDGDDLTRRPVSSLQQALQGQAPGLTILDRGGQPGSPNTQILIRGVNKPYTPVGQLPGVISVVGDNSPLIIVDGIEQPMQNINPDDVESVSVLKDASSTAIYGSRGTNGVILITTKRAKAGKVSVSYNGFYAVQKAISEPQHMDINSYLELENIAYTNVGATIPASLPQYTTAGKDQYVLGTKTSPLKYPLPYDWFNQMYHTAPQSNHSIAISGGSENFKARMSVRSQNQEGIIANTESKLSEVRVNTDFNVSSKISVATDLDYRYQDNTEPNGIMDIFRFTMQNAIWAVPQYPDGVYGGGTQGNSPLLLAEKGGINKLNSNYLLGSITGKWDIIKGLSFSTQLTIRSIDTRGKNHVNTWETRDSTVVKKTNLINKITETRSNNREININSLLNYSVNFNNHGLKFLAGYSQIKNDNGNMFASRQSFYNNDLTSIGAGANDATKDNGGADEQWRLRSFFGRVNYAYKGKYLFEANGRYDGSSKFAEENRYSFFPSFSLGWRISEEAFFSGLTKYVSNLKVRGSWGETGNQAVPSYAYYPTLNPVSYNFNNTMVQGYEQQTIADSDLIWETATQTDIGMDAEFLDGRFTLTVDYYKKTINDIHLTLPIPGVLGLVAGPQNAGVVENQGWEFTLGSRNQLGNFTLTSNLNFSLNNNEVVDLAGTGPYIIGNDIDPRYITGEGYPINAFWGYQTAGLFQSDADAAAYPQFMRVAKAGDVKVLDRNGDGSITPDDMTFLGNSIPKYTFGGTLGLNYKAFSLNILLQGASDVKIRIARALGEQGNFEGFTPDIYTNNYWTPERPDARFPRPTKQDLRNQASTDRMLVDASYLRVKNIQLSYQLPVSLTRKVFMERVNVYVAATNVLTISKLNEWNLDPESSSGWQNYYPQTSVYTLGFNLMF